MKFTLPPHPPARLARRLAGEGAAPAQGSIPVYLLTGFLGSGKTTLLRRMLAREGMADTALIINEFGAVGLDQMLVQSAIENVLLMEDGCLCCSVRGDLVDTIGDLFSRVENGELPVFSRIIIETTGLADPRPIVQDLRTARGLVNRVHLAKVVTTVDGAIGTAQLKEVGEVAAQVAQADLCIVTKCDVVDLDDIHTLIEDLRELNPTADIVRSDAPEAVTAALLDQWGGRMAPSLGAGFFCENGEGRVHPRVQSWSVHHTPPLRWERVCRWLDLLYSNRPADMLRMKGILHLEGQTDPVVLHGVGAMLDSPTVLPNWPWPQPASQIVIVATDIAAAAIGEMFSAIVLDGAGEV